MHLLTKQRLNSDQNKHKGRGKGKKGMREGMRERLRLDDDDTVEIPGNSHVMYPNKH